MAACPGVRFGIVVETLEFEWWASPLTGYPSNNVVPSSSAVQGWPLLGSVRVVWTERCKTDLNCGGCDSEVDRVLGRRCGSPGGLGVQAPLAPAGGVERLGPDT
jgi:hypothetical protein